MRNRILVLPISALIITLLCLYAIRRKSNQSQRPIILQSYKHVDEPFSLPDQNNKPVRLKTYLGRHTILLVFYDGVTGPFKNKALMRFHQEIDWVEKNNIIVLGISSALPQENRKQIKDKQKSDPNFKMPFPLLTDLSPENRIHRQWGCIETITQQPRPGLFLIDRASNVAWNGEFPQPVHDIESVFNNQQ